MGTFLFFLGEPTPGPGVFGLYKVDTTTLSVSLCTQHPTVNVTQTPYFVEHQGLIYYRLATSASSVSVMSFNPLGNSSTSLVSSSQWIAGPVKVAAGLAVFSFPSGTNRTGFAYAFPGGVTANLPNYNMSNARVLGVVAEADTALLFLPDKMYTFEALTGDTQLEVSSVVGVYHGA